MSTAYYHKSFIMLDFVMSLPKNIELVIKFLFMRFYFECDMFVRRVAKQYNKPGKKLIDIGSDTSPYRKMFNYVHYFTLDKKQDRTKTIDYVLDLDKGMQQIAGNSFDYILCTQVLEHLQKPQLFFSESARILKKGGRLFLTTNFLYQIHMAPNDYFRFTKNGLIYLGKSNGFKVEHIKSQGGIFHVLSYLLSTFLIRVFLKNNQLFTRLYLIIFSPIIMALNLLSYVFDLLDKDRELTINYEVIYRKK